MKKIFIMSILTMLSSLSSCQAQNKGYKSLFTDWPDIQVKHFENIWADHFTGNPASGRVMEKCGFSDTGMLNRCSQLVGGDKEMVKVFKYKE